MDRREFLGLKKKSKKINLNFPKTLFAPGILPKQDFASFARQNFKIHHPQRGLIPFDLYPYQARLANDFDSYSKWILLKFRNGGFTTLALLYTLWKCLTEENTRVLYFPHSYISCLQKIIDINLPNDRNLYRSNRTIVFGNGSIINFVLPGDRGFGPCKILILDEPAFVPNMYEIWKALYPRTVKSKVIIQSSPDKTGSWFYDMWNDALSWRIPYFSRHIHFWEHPEYCKIEWQDYMKLMLGDKSWRSQYLCQFIGE